MKLLTRRLQPDDFSACWTLVVHGSRYSDSERERLRMAWTALLPDDAMRGAVIFDADSETKRIIVFGATVFVKREWLEEAKRRPRPFFATRCLLDFEAKSSPILRERQIALDNAGPGLNLLTVHHGWGTDSAPGLVTAGRELVSAFQDCHAGFQFREMMGEVYGRVELEFCSGGGSWNEYSRYEAYFQTQPDLFPAEENEPIMIGATADTCALTSVLWCLFACPPPVLRLSRRQQRVLLLATEGLSISGIAKELDLEAKSVWNCFRAASRKVAEHPVYSHLLEMEHQEGMRPSKSSQLLAVLRKHKEELRPWDYGQPTPPNVISQASDWAVRAKRVSLYRAAHLLETW